MRKIFNLMFILIVCIGVLTGCSKEIVPENMSKEEFDNIDIGDSVFTVQEIVGSGGELISESKKDKVTTYVYKYEGEVKGSAEITYEVDLSNGYNSKMKVVSKIQDNLE